MQYILRKVYETINKSYTFPCKKCFVRLFFVWGAWIYCPRKLAFDRVKAPFCKILLLMVFTFLKDVGYEKTFPFSCYCSHCRLCDRC